MLVKHVVDDDVLSWSCANKMNWEAKILKKKKKTRVNDEIAKTQSVDTRSINVARECGNSFFPSRSVRMLK